jgi:hypothetical protein
MQTQDKQLSGAHIGVRRLHALITDAESGNNRAIRNLRKALGKGNPNTSVIQHAKRVLANVANW